MQIVVDEIEGMTDDFPSNPDELPKDLKTKFEKLDANRRALRKDIWAKQLTTVNTDKSDLRDVQQKIRGLKAQVYSMATEEHTASREIESLVAPVSKPSRKKRSESKDSFKVSSSYPPDHDNPRERSGSEKDGLLGLGFLPVKRIGSRVRKRLE